MRVRKTIHISVLILSVVLLLAGTSFAKARKAPTTAKRSSVVTSRPSSSSASVRKTKTTKTRSKSKSRARTSKVSRVRGQQSPDSDRTREIQTALIRERYLSGEPSGSWDQSTKTALAKFQKDNGWQTRVVPDARALIKLGLGPSRDGLLNPDTAAISPPHLAGGSPSQPGGAAN